MNQCENQQVEITFIVEHEYTKHYSCIPDTSQVYEATGRSR